LGTYILLVVVQMIAHDETSSPLDSFVAAALRRELLRLAAFEEDLAATEAAKVPYWSPCPATVAGHRAAARALREDADRLLPHAA
jgi:hypothetical protein